jgi:RNA polymerase sigma-70 factor (ECF subfamily)
VRLEVLPDPVDTRPMGLQEPFESILDAAGAGGEWAWSRLYQQFSPPLLGYLYQQGAKDPEDLLGEVWLHVARRIQDFTGDESGFRSWLYVIAHHRLVDEWRKLKRRPRLTMSPEELPVGSTESAEDEMMSGLSHSGFLALLEPLTDDQRTVILLRFGADLAVKDVAAAMDKSEGAVKVLQHRAVVELKRNLPHLVTKKQAGTVTAA